VLLPEPFAPKSPVILPSLHTRLPSLRATTPPKLFFMFETSRMFNPASGKKGEAV
jgi:hypothetical protein